MALNMTSATYGRSQNGRTTLKNDFYGDIENLVKILNGDKYTTFKKTIAANWVGADATDFLNDIDKTRIQIQSKLRSLKSQFANAVDADAKQFGSFQSKNVK